MEAAGMQSQSQRHRFKERLSPWALSLVAHAIVLVVLGTITWVLTEVREPDRFVTLISDDTVPTEDDDGPPAGAGAEAGPPENAPPQALLPPVPVQQTLDASLAKLLEPPALTQPPSVSAELTRSLMKTLMTVTDASSVGPLRGVSAGFGKVIGTLRRQGLDVVLVIDATDSMAPYIEQGKKRLRQVITVVTHVVPDSRFGVVAYKDYGDDYGPDAVKVLKITVDPKAVHAFIDEIIAGGGADPPEPINEALAVVTNAKRIGWGPKRKRVVILVGDSSIHPSGQRDAFDDARYFAKKMKGTINVIDVGGTGDQGAARKTVQPHLARIAKEGGGSAFLLRDRDAFWRHLIVSVFGQQYERDVNTIIKKLVDKE